MKHPSEPELPPRTTVIGMLCVYMLIAALLSYPYLTTPLRADPDAYGRVLQAWLPMQAGHFWDIQYGHWPPIHGFILRLGWLLWPDFFRAPQYLTFLISLTGIPLFYLVCRRLFTKRRALVATFLFTVFPLRVILSTQPLTEGIFLPFMLLSLVAITDDKNAKWLWWGIAGLSMAMGIRYEAWLLLPVMWLAIITRESRLPARIVTLLATMIVPAAWILMTHHGTGRWAFFFSDRFGLAGQSMQHVVYQPFTTFSAILSTLLAIIPGPFVAIIILGTFSMLLDQKKYGNTATRIITATPWYYLVILYALVFSGAMEWITPRFFLFISALLLLPITQGLGLLYSSRRIFFWVVLLSAALILPGYAENLHATLTYGALHGNRPQEKYADAQEVIRFINENKGHRFRYIVPADNSADFVTMISYFTKTDLFVTAYLPPDDNTGTAYYIVEKNGSEPLPARDDFVINNESFSVYPKTTN